MKNFEEIPNWLVFRISFSKQSKVFRSQIKPTEHYNFSKFIYKIQNLQQLATNALTKVTNGLWKNFGESNEKALKICLNQDEIVELADLLKTLDERRERRDLNPNNIGYEVKCKSIAHNVRTWIDDHKKRTIKIL